MNITELTVNEVGNVFGGAVLGLMAASGIGLCVLYKLGPKKAMLLISGIITYAGSAYMAKEHCGEYGVFGEKLCFCSFFAGGTLLVYKATGEQISQGVRAFLPK